MGITIARPCAQRVHGMFVGIDHYERVWPANRLELRGCANDARHLAKAAAPALEPDPIVLTNAEATRRSILDGIEDVTATAEDGDLFLLFCACHGVARYGEFLLLPADHDPRRFLGTTLLFQDIANVLGSRDRVNSLVIVDACQSGAIGYDPSSHNRGNLSGIMMAASPLEISKEEEFEHLGRVHGVFAYWLMRKFEETFAEDGPGGATIAEIFGYAYSGTKHFTQNQQHPICVGTLPASLRIERRSSKRGSEPSAGAA